MSHLATRCICFGVVALMFAATLSAEDWSRFRGENGTGVSDSMSVATEWSSDENIQWKMELPGPGSSSPIVVGDKV
ncbi:MAG: PQQ-binding-like beta-propeller repeat protein, partial [Pirellulaceae bacterium]